MYPPPMVAGGVNENVALPLAATAVTFVGAAGGVEGHSQLETSEEAPHEPLFARTVKI